ncbi:MAG: alkaline shock response membrane anchor protein AmaP [Candidatus Omnitrophota bacterium]|nr:alkaline shock response membrane anchor protein AmaP [Candidatus Omnitrophota bacterium]
MRLIGGLTLFFYTLVFFLVGGLFIVVAVNIIPLNYIIDTLNTLYTNTDVRLILGITGGLLIFISLMVVQITVGIVRKERTIAFENPDGQVTISLTAIEDFIKRAMKNLPEVKESRPNVRANKRGIVIVNRVVLFSDANIPETADKIQNIVKSRVQEMLGVEEPIEIRINVVKIVHKEERSKDTKKDSDKVPPYRGTIEYSSF